MNAPEQPRSFKEALARVLDDPSQERFRDLLREHTGEAENLDFKAEWPSDEKLARHVLALGNSGGGCVVIGVAERPDKSLEIVGMEAFKDKVDITKKLNPLVPSELMKNVGIEDFSYDSSDYSELVGKRFQLLWVIPDPEHLPFLAERANADARVGAVYVRRGTESVEASHDELQRIINKRISTGYSTAVAMKLEEHLDQLFILQARIPKSKSLRGADLFGLATINTAELARRMFGELKIEDNPLYPKEDAMAFVLRMFEAKKNRIERELDVRAR